MRPFIGWTKLVEDANAFRSSVRDNSRHFPVFVEFQGVTYLKRYHVLCQRLMREQLYSSAALMDSPRTAAISGNYDGLSEMTSFKTFVTGPAGNAASVVTRLS